MKLNVPHYRQSTDFTCGPACVMMVLKFFNQEVDLDRRLEFEIWRECNMIGALGSDAFGLSIPFLKRGLGVKVVTERRETIPIKRIVRRWGEDGGRVAKYAMIFSYEKAKSLGAKIIFRRPRLADIKDSLTYGTASIVLINMYETHRWNIPHWVVVVGYEDDCVYLNDPYRRKGGFRMKEDVFKRSMDSLASRIGASRSLLQAYPQPASAA